MTAFDLDAYLSRIGAAGVRCATLETLRALHLAHPAAIPFENLNPLIGWPVALDSESLQRKLVTERRGGWCFEQNALFRLALEALGFRVTGLGARVLWNAGPDAPVGARSHMLLRVESAGGRAYLADVGFGGNVLTAPLEWRLDAAQVTPHERHRIRRLEGAPIADSLVLEAEIAGEWKPLYQFTAEPQLAADYEVSNWYLCTHASSFFRHTLVAARAEPGRRYALRNNELAVHTPDGTERRTIGNAAELRQCLREEIQVHLPDSPAESRELDAALARICEPGAGH